ncbi:hypothetical protein RI129_002381 [Pyrocoelia pectoralis]|uniref:Kinesin motor domain-containing protein n=1 Tax=Pyrocoelia pectoralis TaxID=417401 RepID=A0AAN7VNQ4_9COLE
MSNGQVTSGNISYLNPRVLSILAQNYPTPSDNEEGTTKDNSNEDNYLRVYLRIKKAENFEKLYTINNNTLQCKVPDRKIIKMYKFSQIFDSCSTQSDVYIDFIEKKVINFIKGINCTLLTYGASGSALEYVFQTLPKLPREPHIKPTPSGGIIKLPSSEGLQERSRVNYIMSQYGDRPSHLKTYSIMQQHLEDNPVAIIDDDISDIHLSVWISFAEIYNEYVYDLLSTEPKPAHQRKKLRLVYFNNNAYIKDLQHINVTSASEAYYLLQYGLQNLNYAATSVNDHSSRSHSIFTIKLAQASNTKDGVSVSAFNFCDLAGSERLKNTNNVGDRLKESNNINASLLVLGRCIHAIRDSQKCKNSNLIPFRDSKLTQLFQNALLGNESISMIVCINPVKEMFDETQHVLNFSAIAKDVIIEQQQPVKRIKNDKFANIMQAIELEDSVTLAQNVELEALQNYLAFLCTEIEQESLNYTEEREQIISTYKNLIENTKKVWDTSCKDLQRCIEEHNKKLFEESMKMLTTHEKSRKRKQISVICIDTSSDEESESPTTIKKQRKKINQKTLQELHSQLDALKQEKDVEEVEVRHILAKNKSLTEILKDTSDRYQALQSEYHSEIHELNVEIVLLEDKLADLDRYLD